VIIRLDAVESAHHVGDPEVGEVDAGLRDNCSRSVPAGAANINPVETSVWLGASPSIISGASKLPALNTTVVRVPRSLEAP
jgi:hypothetical protein